jgi:hypothetical protein
MAREMQEFEDTSEKQDVHLTSEQAGSLVQAACDFQANAIQARETCREKFRRAESEQDNTLRILVDGQIAALQTQISIPISNVDPALSYKSELSRPMFQLISWSRN